MRYSVIDISSTGVSMIVAEARGNEAEVVFKDRANLTLLHYLNGRDLSARGIEKVVAAVAAMKEKCSRLGADELLLISTAALRAIGNFEEVGAAVLGGYGGSPSTPSTGGRKPTATSSPTAHMRRSTAPRSSTSAARASRCATSTKRAAGSWSPSRSAC